MISALALAAVSSFLAQSAANVVTSSSSIDLGDTAWMLVATGLVLLMTPGLAFFYGGLVRSTNVLMFFRGESQGQATV